MISRKASRLFTLYRKLYDGAHVSLTLEADGSGTLSEWVGDKRLLEWDDPSTAIEILEKKLKAITPAIIHCRRSAYYGSGPRCGKRRVEKSRLTRDEAKVTCKNCLVSIAKKAREQCLNKKIT